MARPIQLRRGLDTGVPAAHRPGGIPLHPLPPSAVPAQGPWQPAAFPLAPFGCVGRRRNSLRRIVPDPLRDAPCSGAPSGVGWGALTCLCITAPTTSYYAAVAAAPHQQHHPTPHHTATAAPPFLNPRVMPFPTPCPMPKAQSRGAPLGLRTPGWGWEETLEKLLLIFEKLPVEVEVLEEKLEEKLVDSSRGARGGWPAIVMPRTQEKRHRGMRMHRDCRQRRLSVT